MNALYEVASLQAGYFTTRQAEASGFSRPLLHYHVKANRFERRAHGLYRLVHYPMSQDEELVVAWLWTQKRGVFSHETALMLSELSDALPAKLHMTAPAAWRTRRILVPLGIVMHFADLSKDEIQWHGLVQVTTPLRTLLDCARDGVDPCLVEQAIDQMHARRLVPKDELARAFRAIGQEELFRRALRLPKRKKAARRKAR